MIERYRRRAALCAALAACADDPRERRRYEAEKADCEKMIQILKTLKEEKN